MSGERETGRERGRMSHGINRETKGLRDGGRERGGKGRGLSDGRLIRRRNLAGRRVQGIIPYRHDNAASDRLNKVIK